MKVSIHAVQLLVMLLFVFIKADDTVPGLQAWKAAQAAHKMAENRLEEHESRLEAHTQNESTQKTPAEPGKKSQTGKIEPPAKGAFKNILKGAINKLLNDIKNKKKPSTTLAPSSSTPSYLDKLLSDLDSDKEINVLSSTDSSLDDLIRRLTKNEYKDVISPRRIKTDRHKLATSASFLDKILNNPKNRRNDFNSRRRLEQTKLERLIGSFDSPQDDFYNYYEEDDDDDFLSRLLNERSRNSFRLYDDYEDDFRRGGSGGRLRQALRESRRLDQSLDRLLDRLQSRRY